MSTVRIPSHRQLRKEDFADLPAADRLLPQLSEYFAENNAAWQSLTARNVQLLEMSVVVPDDRVSVTSGFSNAWVPWGSPFDPPSYWRDGRIVHVDGLLKDGTATGTVFTLPLGYRPSKTEVFTNNGYTGAVYQAAEIRVSSAGVVSLQAGPTGAGALLFLSAITFLAADYQPQPSRCWPRSFRCEFTRPQAVLLWRVREKDGSARFDVHGPPDWRMRQDGQVEIRNVPGLTPGRTWELLFAVVGEV